jgi:PAS domain S-box-containing protein
MVEDGEFLEKENPTEMGSDDNETILSELILTMHDIFWRLDVDLKFIDVNPQALRILGYPSKDIIGHHLSEFLPFNDLEDNIKAFDESLKTKKVISYQSQWITQDGRELIIKRRIKPIWDDNNNFIGFIGIDRDITSQVENKKALKKMEKRYESVFEDASVGMAIVGLEGNFIQVNKALCEFLGYSDKELCSKKFVEITYPDDIQISKESLISILEGHKKADRLKKRYIRKDGQIVWADVNTILIRKKNGDPHHFITHIIDINTEQNAQATLNESEKHIRAIFDTVRSGIFLTDVNGTVNYANNYMTKMFGYELKELIGIPYTNLTFIDERYEARENIMKLIDGEIDHVFIERIYRRKDGKLFWGQLSGTRILNDDGSLLGLIGVITNINERKKAEQDVDRFFRLSSDLLCIVDMDGVFKQVNPSWSRVLGWDTEELVSKSILEFVHPDDLDATTEEIKMARKGHKSVRFMNQVRNKVGSYKWLSWNSMPLPKEKLIYASARDITDRKLIEDALKESEQRLSDIFDFLPDATFAINMEGEVIAWNRAIEEMTGTSKDEIMGKGNFAYSIPWYGEPRPILIDLINEENSEYISRYDYVNKEGQTFFAEVFVPSVYGGKGGYLWLIASPLFDHEGKQYGAIESVRDITERKTADEQLIKSLKEKEVLLQEIHHRVKNNMQIISSLLNLQTQYVDDEAVDVLKESQNRVKSMSIIHEKLYRSNDFTRINIADYINSLVNGLFHSYAIKDDQVTLNFDIDDIKLNIETAVPCGLIISELVSNSLKYAFPDGKGEIRISLKEVYDQIELIISDNGIGLPDDLDIAKNDSLGLKLVNSLTNQIDGQIELDRSQGTTYRIIFKELEYNKRI